ncbi:MAG: hypothetical protein WC044_11885 [Crocinitomicaceae bacterium]
MSVTQQKNISDLSLDLKNFRTTPQTDESGAIHAMIAVNPNRFGGIIDSLLEDEYIPTENIICQKQGKEIIVKEGNRRIAAMKLILGLHKINEFQIPESTKAKILSLDNSWKSRNKSVPCSVYEENESERVERIVALTHGKGDKASRDPWTSVAKARHNRDINKAKEEGLNLLEKYIENGRNINAQQKERWAGDYNLSVLDATIPKLLFRFKCDSSTDLVKAYPNISDRDKLEEILLSIGLGNLGFKQIRDEKSDFTVGFGGFTPVPPLEPITISDAVAPSQPETNPTSSSGPSPQSSVSTNSTNPSVPQPSPTTSPINGTPTLVIPAAVPSPKSAATNTQKHVNSLLKQFVPTVNRPKVVTLRDEMLKLKVSSNPIAFCFLLRSTFEISAKAYCDDNSLSTTKPNGKEKTLSELLTDATNHLTANKKNLPMTRVLHGAHVEITNPNKILSVTSMNQLVHNPSFSIIPSDICTLFSNIYPLLQAMN